MTEAGQGFILVHGGEHGGWCWDRVVPLLGWPAVAVDLPGRGARAGDQVRTGLADNASALVEAVARSGFGRYVLVCHSLGGLTVLASEPLHVTVPARRVFVSGLAPAAGQAGLDALPTPFRWFLRLRLRRPIAARRAVHLLPTWLAVRMWCRGLARADREMVLSRLCAEPPGIPLESTPAPFTSAESCTYIVLDRDLAMSARLQAAMAAGLGITDLRHIDAGHEVMLSHPRELADALNSVAREAFAT